jgi:hypothetical protein
MPVVSCVYCSNPVSLPDPWNGAAYTCPHCHRVVPGAAPPPPPPPPPPARPPREEEEDEENEFEVEDEPRRQPRRRHQPSGGAFGDFLTFRLMVTPIIIQIIFWLLTTGCVFSGGRMVLASFDAPEPALSREYDRSAFDNDKPRAKAAPARHFDSLRFALGVTVMIVGPLVYRVLCELVIIIFKIHDELKAANDRERYRS